MSSLTTEEFARKMYEFYSHEAGRVSLVGTPLPDWKRFKNDVENGSHYRAWLNTMAYAAEILLTPKIESVIEPGYEEKGFRVQGSGRNPGTADT